MLDESGTEWKEGGAALTVLSCLLMVWDSLSLNVRKHEMWTFMKHETWFQHWHCKLEYCSSVEQTIWYATSVWIYTALCQFSFPEDDNLQRWNILIFFSPDMEIVIGTPGMPVRNHKPKWGTIWSWSIVERSEANVEIDSLTRRNFLTR